MGLPTLIKQLYNQTIGGTAPAGAASSSGDMSQMVKYLIDEMAKAVGATNISPSADTSGSLAERVAYIQANLGGAKKVQGSGYLVYPSAADGVDPAAGAGAWASGAYIEVVASTAAAIYVVGVVSMDIGAANQEYELDIATGGSGSESVKTTVAFSHRYAGAGLTTINPIMLPYPIAVPISTRIAVRNRNTTTTSLSRVKIIYINQSDLVDL